MDLLGSLLISSVLGANNDFSPITQQWIIFPKPIPYPIPALAYSLINSNLLDKGLDYLFDNTGEEELQNDDFMLPLQVF